MIEVYAILEEAPRSRELRFVRVGALVAAVRTLETAPALTEEALRERDAAVRGLAASVEAILPARWGSSVKDEAELVEKLAPQEKALVEALALVRGREQMTLRVFGERAPAAPTIAARSGTEYLEARARELSAARSVPEIEPLRGGLAPLIHAERAERNDQGKLLATVHHLIDRGRSSEYASIVGAAKLDVTVRASGPAPPYAFAPGIPA